MGCFEGKHASAETESLPTTKPKALTDTPLLTSSVGTVGFQMLSLQVMCELAHLLLITLTGKQVPAFHQGDRAVPKHKI